MGFVCFVLFLLRRVKFGLTDYYLLHLECLLQTLWWPIYGSRWGTATLCQGFRGFYSTSASCFLISTGKPLHRTSAWVFSSLANILHISLNLLSESCSSFFLLNLWSFNLIVCVCVIFYTHAKVKMEQTTTLCTTQLSREWDSQLLSSNTSARHWLWAMPSACAAYLRLCADTSKVLLPCRSAPGLGRSKVSYPDLTTRMLPGGSQVFPSPPRPVPSLPRLPYSEEVKRKKNHLVSLSIHWPFLPEESLPSLALDRNPAKSSQGPELKLLSLSQVL